MHKKVAFYNIRAGHLNGASGILSRIITCIPVVPFAETEIFDNLTLIAKPKLEFQNIRVIIAVLHLLHKIDIDGYIDFDTIPMRNQNRRKMAKN